MPLLLMHLLCTTKQALVSLLPPVTPIITRRLCKDRKMSAGAIKRVVNIRKIVQLKQVMRRWRALSLRHGGRESGSNSRSIRTGFLAVYVGPERRRFLIPTRFLNLPAFVSLLERAEEEYGFQQAGGLALPCDSAFFRWILDALDRDEARYKTLGLDVFLALFADSGDAASAGACKEAARGSFSPLLTKTKG